MMPNTMLTTKKVPSDSVMVVTTICLPAFFIWFQSSSVPIIRPTVHSRMLSITSNQPAFKMSLLSSPTACGPRIIPTISHPKMAGSLNFEISLPATSASAMATSSLTISKIIISISPFFVNWNFPRLGCAAPSAQPAPSIIDDFVYF